MELFIVVIWAAVFGGVGYWIATQKRRSEVEGVALGCLLGPIGWIIEAVLPTGEPPATRSAQSDETPTQRWASSGPAAPSPSWMRLQGDTPDEALAAAQRTEEKEYAARGYRVVEAAWLDGEVPTIGIALGDPEREYAKVFTGRIPVEWQSTITDTALATPGAADDEAAAEAADAAVGTTERAHDPVSSDDERKVAVAPGSVARDDGRATKDCPDCAETILEAARICRFCRYEFWPEGAPPPASSSGVVDEAGVTSWSEDSTAAGAAPEADAGTQATDQDSSPEPAEPEALQQEPPTEPAPSVAEPLPAAGGAGAQMGDERRPPAPSQPSYAPPPPPPYAPPPAAPPPSGQPPPPPYAPPPPPTWQPPQGQPPGQAPPGQGPGPWSPPPPPPDWPRQ
jgi:hypothetical protein